MSTFLKQMCAVTAKSLQKAMSVVAFVVLSTGMHAQQLANSDFEDWSAPTFDGKPQPAGWHASNVEQFGLKFNFAHKETGHNGGNAMMVQDQSVGALGIAETSPGYFALGQPWAYIPSLTQVGKATAGTAGGILWAYRPDTMSVWIRRTGDNWDKEDFYLLYYAWERDAFSNSYGGKDGSCTSYERTNEESDIRIALNANTCGTQITGEQVSEGMWRERANYNEWTNIRVPIYYLNGNTSKWMNIIFSASNYPNARANSGLYPGNSLYVDDVQLIYSSKIQTLLVDGMNWNGFDPNTEDVQYYALGENATQVPVIAAKRGAGTLTNARGDSKAFPGRVLELGKDYTVQYGNLTDQPTVITVRAEDGSSTTTYRIQFQRAASTNAKLAGIGYTLNGVDTLPLPDFSPNTTNYTLSLPYGTTSVPQLSYTTQENGQTVTVEQATSLAGTASIHVVAPNGSNTRDYNVSFSVAPLADNNLAGIMVNGNALPGFNPGQTNYKVSLPVGTQSLTVSPIKKYDAQNVTITPATLPTGTAIDGAVVELAVTTPGNQTPRKYRLTIKLEASSYSYLADLTITGNQIQKVNPSLLEDSTVIDFTPDNMIYYVTLKMGTTELPAITATKGDEYQQTPVIDTSAGVDGTVRVTSTAGNGDQSVYKIIFSTLKSSNSKLADIKLGGVSIEDFAPGKTTYSVALPVGTTQLPEIEAVPGDAYQTVVVTSAGLTGKTRITVTAGDGSTTIYQISFSVEAFTDNTLKGLSVTGYSLQNAAGENVSFDPEVLEYWVNLPQGTTVRPEVSFELQNENLQTASSRGSNELPSDYRITVRPQNGASRTYILHFTVTTSNNTDLTMIYLDGTPLAGFRADSLHYIDSLPEGVTRIPTVTFDKAEKEQRVISVLDGKRQTITVTAQDGVTKENYTIDFIVRVSANAYLEMIYLDGQELAGFAKQTLDYEVPMTGDRCPAITVDKAPGQQVTIAAPYGAGEATIKVLPESGSANTYTIRFVVPAAQTAQLVGIAMNGSPLDGFRPDSLHYEATYQNTRPVISYTKQAESQTVSVVWKGDRAYLYVSDQTENNATYTIDFTRVYSSDKTLEAIYADSVLIEGFDPAIHNYAYTLEPGSVYPTLSYKAKENTQVIYFGQISQGKWAITVSSEDKTEEAATYTVTYSFSQFSDNTLKDLSVEGYPFVFEKNTKTYGKFLIENGANLPKVNAVPEAGQSVIQYNENDSTQRVLVMAENGATNIYTIEYTRVKSNNVQLANILIDGAPLFGFDPERTTYTVTLPRTASVVPNVNPIAQLPNQTVTTYFGRPGGETKIHVEAQDGSSRDYVIAFPVELSDTTLLKSLTINGEERDVNTTDFIFDVPFGTIQPYDIAYETREGQLVRFVDAPINGVSEIIVTNEKGNNNRTYTISYRMAQPQGQNKVANIRYAYVNAANDSVFGEIVPTPGDNRIDLPYGAKSFAVTEVVKSYEEQTIHFYNGGIRRGATIIAIANREGENDVTYTITPQMPAFDTAGKLESLQFHGVNVPHFRPDVYNYIINVTEQPTESDFAYTAYGNETVNVSALDARKKQVTFTVSGGKTYSVCWFYENDKDPFDFSGTWVNTTYSGASKPSADWIVVADKTAGHTYTIANYPIPYTSGLEVSRSGENAVLLSTIRQAAIRASIPGMMTLGEMNVHVESGSIFGCNSNSSVTVTASNGLQFRNTPEWLKFQYDALNASGINGWSVKVWMSNGTQLSDEANFSKNYSEGSGLKNAVLDLKYPAGNVAQINATLNSCTTENMNNMGGLNSNQNSRLLLQNMHLTYNSALTAGYVNGEAMTLSGTTFTKTLSDDFTGVPALTFTGEVHDQTQTIEWLNNGEWINGKLTAKVVNYGENALDAKRDSTVYTVILSRTPETSTEHTASFGAFDTTTKDDSVFIHLPYGTKRLPDLTITPNSTHQIVSMTKVNKAVTVTVTAEDGNEKTTVYVFVEDKANDAEVEFTAEDKNGNDKKEAVDPATYSYKVVMHDIPTIVFEKKIGQKVDVTYTRDLVTMVVIAADGETRNTYTITREDPVVTTSGQIKEFTRDGDSWADLGNANYETTGPKPTTPILFERKDSQDSVVYIQRPDSMSWAVYGSENHTYVLRYPSDKSNNTELANLLIGGKPYSEFIATTEEYTIVSDTMIVMEAVGAESTQQIVTVQKAEEGEIVVYETTVTAEDGVSTRMYKTAVRRPRSNVGVLSGILLDSVPLAQFDPGKFQYTVTLPSPAVKLTQPKMPSITYLAGQAGQVIELTPGQVNGDVTEIVVKSEDGSVSNTYSLAINAAPSACVDLTGISVNGEPIEQFESGRHFYSTSIKTSSITLDYTADDRFLNVTTTVDTLLTDRQYNYRLIVTAENGSTALYEVMIYVENQSNDAQLANILLNGREFVDFERALNPDLHFKPTTAEYEINLPSGTTVLPEVSAQLKLDGQSVAITQLTDSILLDVTAVDGTKNQYVLHFLVPQSRNANLSMIFLNGDSIPNFDPETYFYQHKLQVGVHNLPEVTGQKAEGAQLIQPVEMDYEKRQATIRVQAENRTYSTTYVVAFQFTQSDVDTLSMIYENGDPLAGFDPYVKYYEKTLPVGTSAFPELYWQDGDDYQTVRMDTVSADSASLVRQIIVTSESKHMRTYTVSYTIEKSAVDTLNMIFVDQKQLPGFKPTVYEYNCILSASYAQELNGELPKVEFIAGDDYQTVMVSQMPEDSTYAEHSLRQKTVITVTAANGLTKTYTIHYPVELSTDSRLNMILLEGKPLANFDSERYNYKLSIESTSAIPVVSVIKKEDAQNYEIRVKNDTVHIVVKAESRVDSATYVLSFERVLSGNTKLNNIILTDSVEAFVSANQFRFNPAWDSYTVDLNYEPGMSKESLLPKMEFDLADTLQSVRVDTTELEDGSIQMEIIVTAPNKDEGSYFITFKFAKPGDNNLTAIFLDEQPIEHFLASETEYTYVHPYGTDESEYFTAEDVQYILSDSLANAEVTEGDKHTLVITVTAQNGKQKSYFVNQQTGLDDNADLLWISVDGDTIRGFDPAKTFYTYDVYKGAATPSVTAQQASENASEPTVDAISSVGDTCRIRVKAANGDVKVYEVYIRETLNKGLVPTANDVLIKRVAGSAQYFIATIRSGVTFTLFDANGRLVYINQGMPEANPNYADLYKDSDDKDMLIDVLNTGEGLTVDVELNKPYIYTFWHNGKKIKSGTIMAR